MNKKDEILKSALSLFSKEGYDNVGIQKIVESVSVTKPTLYHHFGSKQGLLRDVLNCYYTPFLDGLSQMCSYKGDVVKTLETITKYCFEFAKENRLIHNFIMILIFSPEESEARITSRPFTERQQLILEKMFEDVSKNHGNMKGRSFGFAVSFWGVISSYITSFYNGHCKLDNQEVYLTCKQFMYGIFS